MNNIKRINQNIYALKDRYDILDIVEIVYLGFLRGHFFKRDTLNVKTEDIFSFQDEILQQMLKPQYEGLNYLVLRYRIVKVLQEYSGFIVLAGSYVDFLNGNLKGYKDIDLFTDNPLVFFNLIRAYFFGLEDDREYTQSSICATGYDQDEEHNVCKSLKLGIINLILIPKYCLTTERRMCTCKIGKANVEPYELTFTYARLTGERVVSLFQHSVTRCAIDYNRHTNCFVNKECSIVGKRTNFSFYLREGMDFDSYPLKHANNIKKPLTTNSLKTLALNKSI